MNQQFIMKLSAEVRNTFRAVKDDYRVTRKGHLDYVTELDFALQATVTTCILEAFPAAAVLSEEGIVTTGDIGASYWLIDPLDGTSNFIFGVPFCSVSVAYFEDSTVKFGVVVDLFADDVFWAFLDGGAYLNGDRLDCTHSRSELLSLSSGFLRYCYANNDTSLSLILTNNKLRNLGSQALQLCYVAAGRMCCCINLEAKIWDDAAGALILSEAGGFYLNKSMHVPPLVLVEKATSLFSIGVNCRESKILRSYKTWEGYV